MVTELRRLLSETVCALADSGIENAAFEARILLETAGIPRIKLLSEPSMEIPENIVAGVRELAKKRASGYPLQYIAGEWEFFRCRFKVGGGVLIPRQDTEILAQIAEEFLDSRSASERRILDLCAGSGCLGISLAVNCGGSAVCVERSPEAFRYLTENIPLNHAEDLVTAIEGDIFDERVFGGLSGEFDAIVCNPPYLTARDMENLTREVREEPREALYGGADGLDYYREILSKYPEKLKNGGLIAVETGASQGADVMKIFSENGLEPRLERDYAGLDRVVYAVGD